MPADLIDDEVAAALLRLDQARVRSHGLLGDARKLAEAEVMAAEDALVLARVNAHAALTSKR